MEPSDVGRIGDAARLAGYLPYLEKEVDRLCKSVESRTLSTLSSGALTPEDALYAWHEINAYRKVLKKLGVQVKVGVTLGEKHQVALDG